MATLSHSLNALVCAKAVVEWGVGGGAVVSRQISVGRMLAYGPHACMCVLAYGRALMRASRRESLLGTRANPLCRLPAFNVEIH